MAENETKRLQYLEIRGARVHNLRDIDIDIPLNKLVVFTGLSGSGKSSLAFDTIYAEGQRRYLETFSAYSRQFIGNMEKPDVDSIKGLSPVIAIEQKTTHKNPRSTVGTITEIYDFIRLLYARISEAYSYESGDKLVQYTPEKLKDLIAQDYADKKIHIFSPLIKGRKGHYREQLEQLRKKGFLKARIDNEIIDIIQGIQLDRYVTHDIDVLIDSLTITKEPQRRLESSLKTALDMGKGSILILDDETQEIKFYSQNLIDEKTGLSYTNPEPNLFSFNTPYGYCPQCKGIGHIVDIDLKKIIPDNKISIKNGGIVPLGKYKQSWVFKQVEMILEKDSLKLDTPLNKIPDNVINKILFGTEEIVKQKNEYLGITTSFSINFKGIIYYIQNQIEDNTSLKMKSWAEKFTNTITCPTCNGSRLKKESLFFKINNTNISELSDMDLDELNSWFNEIEKTLTNRQKQIGGEIIAEIKKRINFLLNLGVHYLTLNRPSFSLSGGETQRIRLASQIGSQLVGVLYILDEPSIGLHQRDNFRLIESLKLLRDSGNSIIVVEHDEEMIKSSDFIVDIGPGAGEHGGKIVAKSNYKDLLKQNSLTAYYLSNRKVIDIPKTRRKPNENFILLKGATGHNLKNVDLKIPLGLFICITGVSGSGKSSLINETLHPILSNKLYKSLKKPLPYKSIEGLENIDKVIKVDQSPIGKTPRSNIVTYTGVFDDIRKLFSELPEAKIRGYSPGRFSFNIKGGRCETCTGAGVKTIEMNFLPDVNVVCETCMGNRYNNETLEVRYKSKSINDVLNMTVENAVDYFENIPSIYQKLKVMKEVGLGYLKLGQPSTTLSGGESQRVKLSAELSKKDTGKTIYLLDEPTTGLHFEDVRILLKMLQKLVDKGNTIVIIEHNMEVIKIADYIIDIGPEGGKNGGKIVACGSPEEIINNKKSFTVKYLKKIIKSN